MYVCIFIKLHITAQSGPVVVDSHIQRIVLATEETTVSSESFYATRIDPPKGGSMILVTKTSDQTRMYVRMYVHYL